MELLNLFLYLSIAVPLSVVFIMSKSKTKLLVCFVIVGLTIALFCGELNGIISVSLPYTQETYITTFSPMIEELLKILPILIFTFAIKSKRQTIIECSIAVGVGFAILENAFYFSSNVGEIDITIALLRAFGAGMMHVITMLFVGFGLSFIYHRHKLFVAGTAGLIAVAITYHSIYNYLTCSKYNLAAFLLPTLLFIPSMIFIKKICKNDILNGKEK